MFALSLIHCVLAAPPLLLVFLAILYLKFLHTPLPKRADNRIVLQIATASKKLTCSLVYKLLERVGRPQHATTVQLVTAKVIDRVLKAKPNSKIGVFDYEYAGVPVRVYVPSPALRRTAPKNGCIIFIHGGGWMVGNARTYDDVLYRLIKKTGLHAVSINYRTTPKHRFPVCLDDCVRAVEHHLRVGATELGVSPEHTVLMGDSAGGNLTATVCHRLKKRNDLPKLKAAVLIYPVIQFVNVRLPSYLEEMKSEIGLLAADNMHLFHLEYFGIPVTPGIFEKVRHNQHVSEAVKRHSAYKYLETSRLPDDLLHARDDEKPQPCDAAVGLSSSLQSLITNPDYSPIFHSDFDGLPPTMVITVGFDILRDEGILYYQRMKEAGVDTEWKHYDGTFHGGFNVPDKNGRQIHKDTAAYVLQKIAA